MYLIDPDNQINFFNWPGLILKVLLHLKVSNWYGYLNEKYLNSNSWYLWPF